MATNPPEEEGELHEAECRDYDEIVAEIEDESLSPTRIAEDLARTVGGWSGVRNCCDSGRAIAQLKPHFERWVAATVAAHPGSTLVAKGWYGGRTECRSGRKWDGTRWCKGKFTSIVCYVDLG